jgi:hypothetical protein
VFYKHPWGAKTHALAILLLPRSVRNLFEHDGVAHRDDLMDLFAVQALALGCQLAFFLREAMAGALVALALFPVQPPLALLLDATLAVVVVRVGRAPLPIQLPVQSTNVLLIGGQLLTEHRQARLACAGYQRNAGGSQICSDRIGPHGVPGLVMGNALEGQLHEIAIPLAISPLCLWAAGFTLQQAGIFDAPVQAMLDAE